MKLLMGGESRLLPPPALVQGANTSSRRGGQDFHVTANWRFSLKPHACSKSRKCRFLQGFRARDGVGGRPVVSSLWIRFEPFRVPRRVYHVPWFRRHRSSATRKSPEFPRRNAKTRWDEPAGLFDSSHLAVAVLVEAGGIEQPLKSLEKAMISNGAAHKAAQSAKLPNLQAPFERRLELVIERWPNLSESDRNRIVGIVECAE